MNDPAKKTNHTERRAKACVASARATWGAGWTSLSNNQKTAAVSAAIVDVLLIMDEESMSPDLRRLRTMADRALALLSDPTAKFDGPNTRAPGGLRIRSR